MNKFNKFFKILLESVGGYKLQTCGNKEFHERFPEKKLEEFNENKNLNIKNITKYVVEEDIPNKWWIYYLDEKVDIPAACMYLHKKTTNVLGKEYTALFITMFAALRGKGVGSILMNEVLDTPDIDVFWLESYSEHGQEHLNNYYRQPIFKFSETMHDGDTFFYRGDNLSEEELNKLKKAIEEKGIFAL